MTSVVDLEIDVPQARLAELHANPELSTEWMDDVERYEAVAGQPGMPGFQYRLVPKTGSMVFVATVVSRNLPNELRLQLDATHVGVSVTARFLAVSPQRTRLTSEQVFRFRGLLYRALGLVAGRAIRKAHRRHMEAFKRFAERVR